MAKRKTKTDIRTELLEDIKQVVIIKEGAENAPVAEILPTEKTQTKAKAEVVDAVINLVTPTVVEEESQLIKDIKIAIGLVKPKNVVAIPLIFNKFKGLTKQAYNKREVLAEIRRLISIK